MGSLDLMHAWCRANGISVSWCIDSQLADKDALTQMFIIGNSAPVYSGDKIKVVPYDEVSGVGNGAVYNAPTASGPIADLTLADIVYEKGSLPIKYTRKKRTDCDNVLSIEHVDRAIDYAHNTTSECDQKAVAQYGPRKGGVLDVADLGNKPPAGSLSLLALHSAPNAQKIASILSKRSAAGVNRYSFTVTAQWFWLEAMDLITIPNKRGFGDGKIAVRIFSVKETDKRTYEIEADLFIYGLNHPDVKDTTAATGTLVVINVDPGLVNTPIIFEPTSLMLGGSGAQIWFLVSGADPNYGGCIGFVSVDGGLSYPTQIGNIGPGTMGLLAAEFPSSLDPDTTNSLQIDLTESNGSLDNEPQVVADGFGDPCIVLNISPFPYPVPSGDLRIPDGTVLWGSTAISPGEFVTPISGSIEPPWSDFASTDHPAPDSRALTVDGTVIWVCRGPGSGYPSWQPNHMYVAQHGSGWLIPGDKIIDSNGNIQECRNGIQQWQPLTTYPANTTGSGLSLVAYVYSVPDRKYGWFTAWQGGTSGLYGYNYETICPTDATLTSPGNYSLDTYIRRGVQGTPSGDHFAGSFFGVLDGALLKVDLPPQWIGKQLWFKFPAYNKVGGQLNDLSICVSYPYTPRGTALSSGGIIGEVPFGAIDGSNQTFGLSTSPLPPFSLLLFFNGLVLRQGTDYTISGSVITLTFAPQPAIGSSPVTPADWLYAIYRTDGNTSSFDDSVVPSGAIDGVNVTFVMPHAPNPADSLMLFQNGELQLSSGDFSLSGATITDVIAPEPTSGSTPADWLLAWSRRDGVSTGNANAEVPSGTIDGANTAFTLAHSPIPVSALMLFKNKLLMRPGSDYTIAGTAITCVVAPETGASLVAFYRY